MLPAPELRFAVLRLAELRFAVLRLLELFRAPLCRLDPLRDELDPLRDEPDPLLDEPDPLRDELDRLLDAFVFWSWVLPRVVRRLPLLDPRLERLEEPRPLVADIGPPPAVRLPRSDPAEAGLGLLYPVWSRITTFAGQMFDPQRYITLDEWPMEAGKPTGTQPLGLRVPNP